MLRWTTQRGCHSNRWKVRNGESSPNQRNWIIGDINRYLCHCTALHCWVENNGHAFFIATQCFSQLQDCLPVQVTPTSVLVLLTVLDGIRHRPPPTIHDIWGLAWFIVSRLHGMTDTQTNWVSICRNCPGRSWIEVTRTPRTSTTTEYHFPHCYLQYTFYFPPYFSNRNPWNWL